MLKAEKRKCKGCGREFYDHRQNVTYCLNECRLITRQIKFLERGRELSQKQIELLKNLQLEIKIRGRIPQGLKIFNRLGTGNAHAYRIPNEQL